MIGIEVGYIGKDPGEKWLEEAENIGKMLAGFIKKVSIE